MNKTIKLSLFTITLLAGVVLLYNSLRSETSVHQTLPPMEEQVLEEPVLAYMDSVRPGDNRRHYKAETQEGYIGWFESKPIDNPLDNIFHVTIEDSLTGNETIWLDYELHGVEDYTGVAHSINDQLSVGGYMVKKNNAWSQQREQLHPSVLKRGDNVVRFTIPEDADYGYRVRNLSITIEAFNEVTSKSHPIRRLVVNQPTSEFYYGELGYLQGYVLGDVAGNAQVLVENEPVRYNKGSFESLVKKKGQAEKWTVTVKAVFADGQVLSTEVNFNKPAEWDVQNGFDKSIHYTDRMVGPTEGFDMRLTELRLNAEPGVVDAETHVSVTALRARDIPALDAGMVNVTANQAGYRFLPHGTQFKKDVTIEMAYDTTKIPNGYGVNDIRTYFFSEASHHWVAIPRDTVLLASNTTVSRTNHFSDYINAIIKVPESPETQGYTPTSMKDVKAANPATGINLIQPPSANSMGNANLSYPINIPAGRQGMQPQLGISYNSGGGNGWLGLGWDLSVPAITVDTRWGVPRYHKTLESETYVMGGEQLSPVAHRTKWTDRETDKQFYPRIEGSFSKIIRHGTNPADYWWEVTDKSGMKYYYGADSNGDIDENAILRTVYGKDTTAIAHWALVEIKDLNENFVKYKYDVQIDPGNLNSKEEGKQIYLKEVRYTGHGKSNGRYKVVFKRDRKENGQQDARRPDVTINARYGFKQVTADKLTSVEVYLDEELIRSYVLEYELGAFQKTLLAKIIEKDGAGNVFNTHDLNYYDDIRSGEDAYMPYDAPNDWELVGDSPNGGFKLGDKEKNGRKYTDDVSALSGTKSKTIGAGIAGTAGLGFNVLRKTSSLGGSYDYSSTKSTGLTTMIDLNGDGLADKLYRYDDGLWYSPQIKSEDGTSSFGKPKPVLGVNDFLREKSSTNSFGFEAHFGAFIGYGEGYTKSETKTYFADVNGDGLVDIVNNGVVYFNRIEDGHPVFKPTSQGTPFVITDMGSIHKDLYKTDENEHDQLVYLNPLHDAVRVWVAPFDGTIRINAPVNLVKINSEERQSYEDADGVRVTIQHESLELDTALIGADDYSKHFSQAYTLNVQKGDRVFFRVQSVNDGMYDVVAWNPIISYDEAPYQDANRKDIYRYNASDDFVFSAKQEIGMPINGEVKVEIPFYKPALTDEVFVQLVQGGEKETILESFHFPADSVFNDTLRLDNIVVTDEMGLRVRVYTHTNVAWEQIQCQVRLTYTKSTDENITDIYNDEGKPLFDFTLVPEYAIRSNRLSLHEEWVAPLTDTVIVNPGIQLGIKGGTAGILTFSVKNRDSLLYKQPILFHCVPFIDEWRYQIPQDVKIPVTKGDTLFYEYHVDDLQLAQLIKQAKTKIEYDAWVSDTVDCSNTEIDASELTKIELPNGEEACVHTYQVKGTDIVSNGIYSFWGDELQIYGALYRQWGLFSYNGNTAHYEQADRMRDPIHLEDLKLDESLEREEDEDLEVDIADEAEPEEVEGAFTDKNAYKPVEGKFFMMVADAGEGLFTGYETMVYVNKDIMSASRLGEKNIKPYDPFAAESGPEVRVAGINKISKSSNKSYTIRITSGTDVDGSGNQTEPGFDASIGGSHSRGSNHVITEFIDLNGDRFPEPINKNRIQYTMPSGNKSGEVTNLKEDFSYATSFRSNGVTIGASYPTSVKESTNSAGKTVYSVNSSVQAGAGGNWSKDFSDYSLVDVNGDGLPDRVYKGGMVSLNYGYRFGDPEEWGYNQVRYGYSTSYSANLGSSFNLGNFSVAGGLGLSLSENTLQQVLMDINGDGLPDAVKLDDKKVWVAFNTGGGFSEPIAWGDISDINRNISTSESANIAITYGFTIFGAVKVNINPKIYGSKGVNKQTIQISDVDGDGYSDFVSADATDKLSVRKSTIARTNLLKTVQRPLGGSFTLDYKVVGNTYEMPQAVWALSKVEMNDGHKGDGVDKIQTSFEYANGYHDRHERTFYGFGEVKTKQLDEGGAEYRSTTRTFANNNYFEKGLLLNETIQDDKGNKYVETINEYELKDRDMKKLGNGAEKLSSTIAFPALVKTTKQFYEGKAVVQKSTYTTFEYGSYGNVHKYVDYGDEGDEDNISASIAYHELKDKNILSVPKSITVTGSGKTLRQRSTLIDETTGKITKITQQAKNGNAVYDLFYDSYGNLDSIVRPANYKGERMYFAYDYDKVVNSYVTAVRDAYGYSSSTTYDYKFGQVLSTTDINGKQTVYEIDELGRITDITGPYELESGQDYTIHFDYYPDAAIPWAQTKHYDPEHPENPIETAIFIDGLGRVLQTKKDGALFKGKDAEDKEVMLVSGKVMYDAFGRSIASYYPVSEDKGSIDVFNTTVNKVKPTTVEYDVLDRALVTTLPDGASTETEYGFGEDRNGNLQFMTRVTDANGISTESFTDVKGRQTAVKAPGDTWTSFVYNAINELESVTDAEDNTTVSTYDMLGRRLSRLHPDAGLTEYSYDAAGNMLTQMTANLRENKQPITYEYEYNRLTNINYPENTVNNVRFEYGETGAEHNRAGRIVVQEDATGAQEFFYGNLGEITKNIRTIIVPDDGVYTFETEWEYDTWNRLKKMTYPDGEELSYEYNKGGLLRRMYGQKKGHRYNYLKQVGYDEFEDRAYIAYGNGTETYYDYEEVRRRLHNIVATTSAGHRMMDNTYTYDKVNNITMLKSEAPIPASNLKGGSFEYIYKYDDLYRLTDAAGHYKGATHEHKYRMAMDYSPTGSILSKKQNHVRKEYDESDWGPRHKTTYDLTYKYEGKQPHAPSQIGENTYTYDANGNTTGWQSTKNNNRRNILWDEENRIRAIADNGKTHHYLYDASGERVIKSTGDGQAIYINGFPMGGSGTVGSYTMYVNPYMVVTNSKFTKHFYIEGQRIVSKLGEMGEYQYLLNPKDSTAGGNTIDFDLKGKELKEAIYANFESLGLDGAVFTAGKSGKVPYGRLKKYYRNQDLVNGGGNANQPDSDETPSNKAENLQFYYHPDHLGSSSYITDVSGEVYQHMEYFPFGETFIEERTDAEYTSYLYNGKELDAETGLYYYGARYYDPRISMFYGVDPLAEKYSFQSPFAYAANNPLKFIDWQGLGPDDKVFSKGQVNRFLSYVNNNIAKKKTHSEYGYGISDRHDCITSVVYGARYLNGDMKIKAGTPMSKQMSILQENGYAGKRFDFDFLDKNGNVTKGVTQPVSLEKSVSNKMIDLSDQGDGSYMFGLSLADDYHSATIKLDKKGDKISFTFIDQNQVGENLSGEQLDNIFTDYVKRVRKSTDTKTTISIWQYINKNEMHKLEPKGIEEL